MNDSTTTRPTKLTREQIIAKRRASRPSFDVTCTIGTVFLDGDGPHTPLEAAMLLIAQHGAPGTFRFPAEQGGFTTVTVDHDPEV
jgi:hypothetical protein